MKGLTDILIAISATVVVFVYADTIGEILDMPDVHFSNSTQQCVGVVNYAPNDDYSWENLPEIYNHVWAK